MLSPHYLTFISVSVGYLQGTKTLKERRIRLGKDRRDLFVRYLQFGEIIGGIYFKGCLSVHTFVGKSD